MQVNKNKKMKTIHHLTMRENSVDIWVNAPRFCFVVVDTQPFVVVVVVKFHDKRPLSLFSSSSWVWAPLTEPPGTTAGGGDDRQALSEPARRSGRATA